MYDLFDGEEDDDTECSFIESIRFGTYDENGQLTSKSASTSAWDAKVTDMQKILLAISIGLCVCFIVYACYLHHAMTNLLIKSLSHRELLPPSRHRRRSPRSGSSTAGSRRRQMTADDDDEPDWHKPV